MHNQNRGPKPVWLRLCPKWATKTMVAVAGCPFWGRKTGPNQAWKHYLWLISTGILKRKFLADDGASFLDPESIWILSIASFLIEINAKYLQKASNKNCSSPNLVYIIDCCSFYMNSHDVMCLFNSAYILVCIWGHNMT